MLDLHNDLLTKLTHSYYDFDRPHAPATFYNPLRLDLDLPRIRQGGIHALGCLMFAGFRVNRSLRFWRQLDCARRLAERHADAVVLARSADDIRAARAAGKLALFLGVEGSYAIDDDPEAGVARLAEAGVRFLGPLWERDSRAGTSCRTRRRTHRGLTEHGKRLVRLCNDAGLLLDVSHASKRDLLGHRRDLAQRRRSHRTRARRACTRTRATSTTIRFRRSRSGAGSSA